ncbi:hypothetical protein [uncultured Tenacibaculum sp.]|uniref:tellurite resistance TerB family protein n=1 Tax=uncultured Tenacibaculum sp. TaxID=174713 RepID=UPI0026177A7E|nr:hypothetical protein [uncultured Tenacibaculum sp.]
MHNISEELKAHFLRLYSMAFTDDNFHHLELKMLYDFAKERGVPKETLDNLLLNPSSIEKNIPESLIQKITYLYQLSQMIWADGKVDDNERNTLKKYIKLFGFKNSNIDDLSNYFLNTVEEKIPLEKVLKEL